MAGREFYTAASIAPDGAPVVLLYLPSGPNEPHFEMAMGARSARLMAAALVEIADAAEKLASVTPTGSTN